MKQLKLTTNKKNNHSKCGSLNGKSSKNMYAEQVVSINLLRKSLVFLRIPKVINKCARFNRIFVQKSDVRKIHVIIVVADTIL